MRDVARLTDARTDGNAGSERKSALTIGYNGDTFSRTMDFMADWINKRY